MGRRGRTFLPPWTPVVAAAGAGVLAPELLHAWPYRAFVLSVPTAPPYSFDLKSRYNTFDSRSKTTYGVCTLT
jgi:hypothetical protein